MQAQSEELFYSLGGDVRPTLTVADRASVRLRTLDASGGQFVEGFDHAETDRSRLFPVTGPVGIDGVRAGDVVRIDIESIEMDEVGHTWTRAGLGFASPTDFHVRRLSTSHPVIGWGSQASFPITPRPHIGALGVLPAGSFEPRSLAEHGGNVDTVHLGAGSTLWLTAQRDGGGVFAGDVHATIGDAEVCGTGIEVAANVELRLSREDRWLPTLPTLLAGGRYRLIADGDTTDEALERGVRACTELFGRATGMSAADAYLAVGLLLEVELCQVVNPRRSVAVSLGSGADVVLGPDWRSI